MGQRHVAQAGIFHVTTNAEGRVPWLTINGVPEIIIDNLFMTRNVQQAKVYAFCILPNHMHVIVEPGMKGISRFVQSFKSHIIYDIQSIFRSGEPWLSATEICVDFKNLRWQKGFHDERLRDDRQYDDAKQYVECNAFRHDIVDDPSKWLWSSLHFAHLLDAREIW